MEEGGAAKWHRERGRRRFLAFEFCSSLFGFCEVRMDPMRLEAMAGKPAWSELAGG